MEKRKIYGTIIGVFVFVLLLLGLTSAYFYWSSGNSKTNVNLTVSRGIEGLIVYNQGTSILGTANYTLQPSSSYTGGISATIEFWKVASATQNIYGQISFEVLQMLSRYNTTDANIGKSDTIKWAVTTYTATNSTETLLKEGTFNGRKQGDKFALVSNISLNNYQTFYKIYIWMDENATDPNYSVASELLSTEISASATDVMYQFDSPALTTLTNLGITPESTYLTTFTSGDSPVPGVYVTEDDLGPSYYFRGNVTNNYVKFGKNSSNQDMYWRIIRINGDGTIRMIYDGTQVHQNGTSSTNRQVGTSAFNTNNADNAFVGYMNGTINGTTFPNGTSNSISYVEAHANKYNSTIKTYLESWYRTNIDYTGYSNKVADAIYCNDRSIFSGDGFGTSSTSYNAIFDRYNSDTDIWSPTLICLQANDKFTKSTTLGNGKLTYPVGLITIDEGVFAGGYSASSSSYYLYTGNWYWTLSPSYFMGNLGLVLTVDSDGNSGNTGSVDNNFGVRPVISLKSNAITGGTGAPGSPFTT